jgi:hypothetical protein
LTSYVHVTFHIPNARYFNWISYLNSQGPVYLFDPLKLWRTLAHQWCITFHETSILILLYHFYIGGDSQVSDITVGYYFLSHCDQKSFYLSILFSVVIVVWVFFNSQKYSLVDSAYNSQTLLHAAWTSAGFVSTLNGGGWKQISGLPLALPCLSCHTARAPRMLIIAV